MITYSKTPGENRTRVRIAKTKALAQQIGWAFVRASDNDMILRRPDGTLAIVGDDSELARLQLSPAAYESSALNKLAYSKSGEACR